MRFKILAALFLVPLVAVGCAKVKKIGNRARHPVAEHRVVYVAGGLTDEQIVILTSAVSAGNPDAVVLLDTPKSGPYTNAFLSLYRPTMVVPVGSFPAGLTDLQERIGATTGPLLPWSGGPPTALWNELIPYAESIVIVPAASPRLLLQAACLAGAVKAPLFVVASPHSPSHSNGAIVWGDGSAADESAVLQTMLNEGRIKRAFVVGNPLIGLDWGDIRVTRLADENAVAVRYLNVLAEQGPIEALVATNPFDNELDLGRMSVLAPWIALQHRAPLLFTNKRGDNMAEVVHAAQENPALRQADALLLVANLRAIPMERRPNPLPGKDKFIEVEPLTPNGNDLFTFATGRLFHKDLNVVALMQARRNLLEVPQARSALLVTNPGGDLRLTETLARFTGEEFHNRGYRVTIFSGRPNNPLDLARLLPEQDIFLWEGHHNAMGDYGLGHWNQPLRPSLFFLQSCYALNELEVEPFFSCGAVAAIGSTTRVYSGSGSAFALAFFNAFLYDGQSVGDSLRQAKNFMLCYAQLKENRLGPAAKKRAANLRAAWQFALWGDPTLKLPSPPPAADALPAVRHGIVGDTIVIKIPGKSYANHKTGYITHFRPNERLAGLLRSKTSAKGKRLVPLVFAEVHLPNVPTGKVPKLETGLSDKNWIFRWNPTRKVGYLLLIVGHAGTEGTHFLGVEVDSP